jgi:hypothetical protein
MYVCVSERDLEAVQEIHRLHVVRACAGALGEGDGHLSRCSRSQRTRSAGFFDYVLA